MEYTEHNNTTNVVCPFCDTEHDSYDDRHEINWNDGEEWEFKCKNDDCEKTFKVTTGTKIHFTSEASDDDPYWDID